jgi:peptide/nickel transport system substrate-binding protein
MSFRSFSFWSTAACVFPLLLGCLKQADTTEPSGRDTDAGNTPVASPIKKPLQIDPGILESRSFGEAPMLAERVRTGALPPITERLPEPPLVLVPVDEIGSYGGELRRALTSEIIETRGVTKTLNENLMGYERPIAKSIQLNLAESFEFENENRTAVIRIRKGVKWSDGHPFTVDDILFWYNDIVLNDEAREDRDIFPPTEWIIGGEPARFEKQDDHTLTITALKPLGRVQVSLCQDRIAYPKHFWARYHPKYNPEATYEDFRDRTKEHLRIYTPGVPTLSAWIPFEWIRGQQITFERNPYYWKVDTAGNQLPYADRLVFRIVQDPQVILLRFVAGELDLFGRYFRDKLIPLLMSEAARGTFRLRTSVPQYSAGFFLNWDVESEPLKEAFRNRDVRVALSHAIDREEISQTLYQGTLIPAGYSLAPSSPYFSEESSRAYSRFDPELAESLLESAGYRDGDGDGFRELKDGSRFEFTLDVRISQSDICELVMEHWRKIGIKVHLYPAMRDILEVRRLGHEFEVAYWDIEGAEDPMSRQKEWTISPPIRGGSSTPFWHSRSWKEGPEWLWEATALFEEARTTVEPELLRERMIRFRDLYTENIPAIGVGLRRTLWAAHGRLGNVPDEITASGVYRGWSRPVMHEQLYIKE